MPLEVAKQTTIVRLPLDVPDAASRVQHEASGLARQAGLDPEATETLGGVVRRWTIDLESPSQATLTMRHLTHHGGGVEVVVQSATDSLPAMTPGQGLVVQDCWEGMGQSAAVAWIGQPDLQTCPAYGVRQHAYGDGVFCGDAWAVVFGDASLSAVVIDGLGHGPMAETAALAGIDAFLADPFGQPLALACALHMRMSDTRGGVGAIARVDRERDDVDFLGFGDISARLVGLGRSRGLASQPGIFGGRHASPRSFTHVLGGDRLVMHTDGIRGHWDITRYGDLARRHPALMAAVLHRDCARLNDDGTILVVAPQAAQGMT